MGSLLELKECLRKLDYPNLNVLGDEEIAEIFGVENRMSFLTWFVQKLNPHIVLPQDPQESANIISDIIRERGFCTSSEKSAFVQGDSNLSTLKQLEIVKRMLICLVDGQEDKENVGVPCNIMSVEDVVHFTKMDINLFPAYGSMKTRKSEDRLKKIRDVERQILQVKKEIETLQGEENYCGDTMSEIQYVNTASTLEETAMTFHNVVEFLLNRSNKKVEDFHLEFSKNIGDTVAKCDSKIQAVADVVKSLSTISNISQDPNTNISDEGQENVDLITELAVLSNKVKMGNNPHTIP